MFNFFKNNKKPKSEYPKESSWSILQGNNNGHDMFIRKNDSAKEFAGHPDYSIRIGIAIPLRFPDERGLPNPQESEWLNAIEDALCAVLEKNQHALQVLAITTMGMREFVFYAKEVEQSKTQLEKIKHETKTHEVQFYLERDVNWDIFMQFN